MTEWRPMAQHRAMPPQTTPARNPGWLLQRSAAGLGLGAALTVGAVAWAQPVLGLLSLLVVFGSVVGMGLGLVRHYAARFRRP
jgi:hypothetical protein